MSAQARGHSQRVGRWPVVACLMADKLLDELESTVFWWTVPTGSEEAPHGRYHGTTPIQIPAPDGGVAFAGGFALNGPHKPPSDRQDRTGAISLIQDAVPAQVPC